MSWAHQFGGETALNGTNSSVAVSLGSAVSVGQLICWGCGFLNASGTGTTFAATDTLGNSYSSSILQKYTGTNNHAMTAGGYSIVTAAGTPTITCTLTGSGGAICLAVDVYSQAGTATYGTATGGYAASGTASAAALTLSGSNSWLVWACSSANASGGTYTAGTGMTQRQKQTATACGTLSEDALNLTSTSSPFTASANSTVGVVTIVAMSFQEVISGSGAIVSVFFPDRAATFSRSTPDSYSGLLSGMAQSQYDMVQPPGNLWLPDRTLAPPRSIPTSYGGLSFQQIADLYQPSGSPVWPGAAKASARAASYDVAIWQTPATTAIIVTTAGPFYPDRTPVAIRAGVTSYGGITLPQIADLNQPAGSQVWPLVSPSAKRATSYDVATWQTPSTTTLVVSAAPFYPDRPPAPLRTAVLAYDARSYQQIGDALQPPGVVVSPQVAPGYRRAATYDVSLHQPPILVAPTGPFGHPWFPERAIGLGRAAASTYSVTTLTNVPSSAPLDLGRFRLGSTISAVFPIGSQTTAPVATFSGPGGNIRVPLTTRDGTNWTLTTFLGIAYQAGTYTTTITNSGQVQFEVVAGGDYGGGVIALFATQNVNGWQVLAQLQNGSLVMGKNPRVA